MQNIQEVWQTEINGQIYDTNLEELVSWVQNGTVLPQDKVRRGNLRWIEAQKVPHLYGHFKTGNQSSNFQFNQSSGVPVKPVMATPPSFSKQKQTVNCCLHSEREANYSCHTCFHNFCWDCPRTAGGLFNLCPMCGAICEKIEPEITENNQPQPIEQNAETQQIEERKLIPSSIIKPDSPAAVSLLNIEPPKAKQTWKSVLLFFLMVLFGSVGGGYIYSFLYLQPNEEAEKKVPEIVMLDERLNIDNQGLVLKYGKMEIEERKNKDVNTTDDEIKMNVAGKLQKDQAALKNKYDVDRAALIETYRFDQKLNNFIWISSVAFILGSIITILGSLLTRRE
ncbi:MAG: hypothetical protein K1X72_27305 [Pyrinomonadaceae bacterium]|nr:hypothetical protein [Pyrinomonadaceae bacterium]